MNNPIKKKWQVLPSSEKEIIRQILVNRGITKASDQDDFLKPDFDKGYINPLLLKDMTKAVELIRETINNKQKIGLFGDYDADGLPATALMIRGLRSLGFNSIYPIIPTREEGYGLSEGAVKKFIEQNCSLVITIDNGITAKDPVKDLEKNGLKTIIIDHHLVQKELLPKAAAIINPKQIDCSYPEKFLSAGALVFKTLWALYQKLEKNTNKLKWFSDLVAVTTITDMVPLTGENRLFAYFGLIGLNKTKNIGLQSIIATAGLKDKKVDSYHVGYVIGPRLNAVSRMEKEKFSNTADDEQNIALKLLITENENEAKTLANYLNVINQERQNNLETALELALAQAKEQVESGRKILILDYPQWQPGIVGLIASRVCEYYQRPTLVFSHKDQHLIGSARSISKYHLLDNLNKVSRYVEKFGGHALAAGLTVSKDSFKEFKAEIHQTTNELGDEDFIKLINFDAEINLEDLSFDLADKVQKLAPYGFGNPQPIFLIKGRIRDIRLMGANKDHLSFVIYNDKTQIKVIAFQSGHLAESLKEAGKIQLLANISINEWNGQKNIQLRYIDYQKDND